MRVFGKNAVLEMLTSGHVVEWVAIPEGLREGLAKEVQAACRRRGVKLRVMPKSEFLKIENGERSQGIVAEAAEFVYTPLEELLEHPNPFLLLLDGVEDPHNLGAILRVADCAGVTGVVLPKNRSVQISGTVAKVSAGAVSHVKVAQVGNLHQAIEQIKAANVFVYAADMDGESMYNTNLEGKIAIVVGGEGSGVSALTKKLVDGVVSIPMYGKVNSLNASVSAGVVLYEVVRQRVMQ